MIPGKARIYTHRLFTLGYNGDQIVEVNMTSSNPRVVEVGTPLKITTSITFIKSTIPFKDRFNRYLEYNFFESQIHWFSIFNSFMIVVFLAGLVALIMMRTLSLDYVRYSQQYDEDSIDMTMRDDSGWKRNSWRCLSTLFTSSYVCHIVGGRSPCVFYIALSLYYAS